MPVVPPPPDFKSVTPRFHVWPAGVPIVRVHKSAYASTSFNPGRGIGIAGRFHFFAGTSGTTVPILYGAENDDAAIAETLFRDVPLIGTGRVLPAARFNDLAISRIASQRDLNMVELLGHGLSRLGLRPHQLTATEASEYASTILWAKALHDAFASIDGLVWMSRHFNAAKAIVCFGDRVASKDLIAIGVAIPLAIPGPGLTAVYDAANKAGITII